MQGGKCIVLVQPKCVISLPPWAQALIRDLVRRGLTEEEAVRLIFAYGVKALEDGLKTLDEILGK